MTNRLSQDNDSPIFEFEVPISVAFRKLDVFGRGGDEGLWRLFFPQSSGWSTWTSISGGTAIEGEPAAVLIQIGSTFLGGVRYFHSFTKIRRLTDDSHWIPSGAFDNCVSRGLGKPPNTFNNGSGSLAVVFFWDRVKFE